MLNRRKDERHSLENSEGECQIQSELSFEVLCSDTGQSLGFLEDASAHGVCLRTSSRNETQKAMSITIKFPTAIDSYTQLALHIRSLWCCKDDQTGQFLTGCHVVTLPTSETEVFEALLDHIARQAREALAQALK